MEKHKKYFRPIHRPDSYPREKSQGEAFEKAIAPVDLIISLECSADTMVQRILNRAAQSAVKRADDNEETIKNRIATFISNTDEILNQYPSQTKKVIVFIRSIHFGITFTPWFHSFFPNRLTAKETSIAFLPMFPKQLTIFWLSEPLLLLLIKFSLQQKRHVFIQFARQ